MFSRKFRTSVVFTQAELNDLVRDLGLTKKAELLGSGLKEKYFLASGMSIYQYRRETLIDPIKVLLPSLHIKLGLMKQFVKAVPKDIEYFKYLSEKFPYLSEAILKVFVGTFTK